MYLDSMRLGVTERSSEEPKMLVERGMERVKLNWGRLV
jgi:hypothetical protein